MASPAQPMPVGHPARRGDRARPAELRERGFRPYSCGVITGKPDQNASSERFNRSYRTEVLNAHLFESLAELRTLTDAWLWIYNGERPHDSLGRVPPLTFPPRPSAAGQSPFELST